jgi:hypothetical protein
VRGGLEKPKIRQPFKVEEAAMRSSTKLSMSAFALVAIAAGFAPAAKAQNYPWCALYNGGGVGGGTNCGFISYEQCMATASGLGKFCVRNTQYVPPPGPHSRRYPY